LWLHVQHVRAFAVIGNVPSLTTRQGKARRLSCAQPCMHGPVRRRSSLVVFDVVVRLFWLMVWGKGLQVKALKEGKTVQKPIYNHVSGLLDAPEDTSAPRILIIEGLHPFFDDRVAELCDYKIYLDISDDVKFAWKIQRDAAERGHSVESIKASIEARKPDFDAFIDPQKSKADMVVQVCALVDTELSCRAGALACAGARAPCT
jgi:hypothetical protein